MDKKIAEKLLNDFKILNKSIAKAIFDLEGFLVGHNEVKKEIVKKNDIPSHEILREEWRRIQETAKL
jgi:hypothetical protein